MRFLPLLTCIVFVLCVAVGFLFCFATLLLLALWLQEGKLVILYDADERTSEAAAAALLLFQVQKTRSPVHFTV